MRTKLRIGVCPKDECPSIGTVGKQCPRHIGVALIAKIYRIEKQDVGGSFGQTFEEFDDIMKRTFG